jgi:hypothetical protein
MLERGTAGSSRTCRRMLLGAEISLQQQSCKAQIRLPGLDPIFILIVPEAGLDVLLVAGGVLALGRMRETRLIPA